MRDYLKLHLVILLWGLTAVLGKSIDMSATQVVLIRSVVASAILFAVFPDRAVIPRKQMVALVATGFLLGFHCMMFFLSVKIANVSICMIGAATIAFWTALLEPLLVRKVKFQWTNLLLGCAVILAVYWIYHNETQFHHGLLVALVAAVLATLFSIANGLFAGKIDEQSVVMYELAGAAIFCSAAVVVGNVFGWELVSDRWLPTPKECIWFAVLILGGTILAYQMYVELLRRLSVFTINFANNLEPVYGITLGAIVFGDHRLLGADFYWGTAVILAVVILQPLLTRRQSVPVLDQVD